MVFEAGEFAQAVGLDVGLDVIEIEVVADVAVEIAVPGVAGITLLRRPDLHARLDVAPERRRAGTGVERGVDAVTGARLGVHDGVGVDDEPADFRLLQKLVDARRVGAFRQPDAARIAPEAFAVVVARDHDLRPDRLGVLGHQRQVAVRRAAGDDFEFARVLEFAESGEQVAVILVDENVAAIFQPVQVEPGELVELVVALGAVDFLVGQLDRLVDAADIAVLQKLVAQHRGQRRRDRHGQPEIAAVVEQSVHHVDERNVGFRDGLIQPVFLEKLVVLGMPDEGEMRVEEESEIALGCHDGC